MLLYCEEKVHVAGLYNLHDLCISYYFVQESQVVPLRLGHRASRVEGARDRNIENPPTQTEGHVSRTDAA